MEHNRVYLANLVVAMCTNSAYCSHTGCVIQPSVQQSHSTDSASACDEVNMEYERALRTASAPPRRAASVAAAPLNIAAETTHNASSKDAKEERSRKYRRAQNIHVNQRMQRDRLLRMLRVRCRVLWLHQLLGARHLCDKENLSSIACSGSVNTGSRLIYINEWKLSSGRFGTIENSLGAGDPSLHMHPVSKDNCSSKPSSLIHISAGMYIE